MSTDYQKFLEDKQFNIQPMGFDIPLDEMNPMLFGFQKDIVRYALRRGRLAVFADCGLGKTPIQLEWARHVHARTDKPILILAPLAVSRQTIREGKKFGIVVSLARENADIINGINITNYEMLHKFDTSVFSGIVLDESCILKSYTGKVRTQIIESFTGTQFKLACTATPAPNDYMELGNHAEFLGAMTRAEMLAMFFVNDASDTGTWRLKGHAQERFWEWMSQWAVMLKKPSDLGYSDDGFVLPSLEVHEHTIEADASQVGHLFAVEKLTLSERRAARKSTLEQRVEEIANTINGSDEQWLVWCELNAENDALAKRLPDSVQIKGSDAPEHKEASMIGFANGDIRVLVTKPSISGYGMNWQNCHNMIFVGLSDSYEQYYQAVRRCWRFGQPNTVNVHVIESELDGCVISNLRRKEKAAEEMSMNMVQHMATVTAEEMKSVHRFRDVYREHTEHGDGWTMYLGDCVEVTKTIHDDSVGYSIFSPPFAQLFTYTSSHRDMGNCKNDKEFAAHFDYLIGEIKRVLMPGRLVSIHCMNLPMTISRDGVIGMRDFRGDIIRMFEKHGFIYHSEVCIWKDPLLQAVRTKVLTLAHKQISKDSSRCSNGFPDYVVTMRKPGENYEPISHGRGFEYYVGERPEPTAPKSDDARINKYSHEVWQRYASPVWFDIRQTRTLNERAAREHKDERHICPLQLDTIERCLNLWSNPGDTVFSPFAGIGSEGYVSLQLNRKFIGIELKEAYFNESCRNLRKAKSDLNQGTLFEEMEPVSDLSQKTGGEK